MASKVRNSAAEPRRVRIDELRSQQKAAERKRNLVIVGIALVIGLGLVAVPAFLVFQQWRDNNRPVEDFGVSASAASCGEVIDDTATGVSDHVGPGTPSPDVAEVQYDTSPPSSGQHFGVSAGFARSFFTREDTPPVENLVHNLEHGATILWYDDTVGDEQIDELEKLAGRVTADEPKFMVAAWDTARGEFPEGSVALSHWGADAGHRQYCDELSGEAVAAFVEQFPYTDSPEPNAG